MNLNCTRVFDRIASNYGKRIQVLQGGTSSSKTYSILQFMVYVATQSNLPLVMSVVAETSPNLHRGAIRDFINILGDSYHPNMHNKSTDTFTFGKSIIEFFSVDQPHKARGPRRDWLFVNEANNVAKETYDQLAIRTRDKIFIDFNPVSSFWAHDLIADTANVSFDKSTYLDNPYLSPAIIRDIESKRDSNPNWWNVYGLGEVGMVEGKIIPAFELVDDMPDIDTDIGLDFGFTNDPTACIEVGIKGDDIYINELFYDHGLTNQDICQRLHDLGVTGDMFIIADSAEPKSIEEIHREGYLIKPCVKGPDSFLSGVDHIKRYNIKVTKSSLNVIKDFRNASWERDRDGNWMNKAEKGFLHSIDAVRYGINRLIQPLAVVTAGSR